MVDFFFSLKKKKKKNEKKNIHSGEDLATTSYGKFVAQLVLTIPDRFMALGKEAASIPSVLAGFPSWKFNDYAMIIQLFIRLAFVYLLGLVIGRQSIIRPVPTSSIFFAEYEEIEVCYLFWGGVRKGTKYMKQKTTPTDQPLIPRNSRCIDRLDCSIRWCRSDCEEQPRISW